MSDNIHLGRLSAPIAVNKALRAIREEIRNVDRYVPPLADRSLVNLSLNEHYAPPSPRVCDALRDLDPMRLVTYDVELTERLRGKIAEREGVSISNVLLSTGSSSALQLLFSCLSDGPVLLPSICWNFYLNLTRLRGLPVETYDVTQGASQFFIDLVSASKVLARGDLTLALFINPHMPTGALADTRLIAALAASNPDTLVLVDEAYHGFSPLALSLASVVPNHRNLVVSKTFSKFFGLAGIRMGYLIAHETIVDELNKASSPFSVPFVSVLAALAALESEPYYRELAVELATVKTSFAARISQVPGVRPYSSHANFFLVELETIKRARQAEYDIQQAGITIRSASSYGLPRFLRITVGAEEAMACLTGALEKGAGRHAVA